MDKITDRAALEKQLTLYIMDLLNGHYKQDWLNAGVDTLECQMGYHWDGSMCVPDEGPPPDDGGGGAIYIPDPDPTPTGGVCTQPSGTPCDMAFNIQPNPYPCTSYNGADGYHNVAGEAALIIGAVGGAINGIGAAVGQFFGMKTAQATAEAGQIQAELELERQKDKRTTTLNIIIGVVAIAAIGVGVYATVKYVNRKK